MRCTIQLYAVAPYSPPCRLGLPLSAFPVAGCDSRPLGPAVRLPTPGAEPCPGGGGKGARKEEEVLPCNAHQVPPPDWEGGRQRQHPVSVWS